MSNILYAKSLLLLPKEWEELRAPDKRGYQGLYKEFFLFLNKNICCDPSLEPSQLNGSKDVSQHKF